MLKSMPDNRGLNLIDLVRSKSEILSLGIDLQPFYIPMAEKDYTRPVILWNHRWEYDKDPEAFYNTLRYLQKSNLDFGLIVCGEAYEKYPPVFDTIKDEFSKELIHIGYASGRSAYRNLLKTANIIPVTSNQEFFGQSVMEAIRSGCLPLLPDALAYPEHLPESMRSLLYVSTDELNTKLHDACQDLSVFRPFIETMQQIAAQYDWSVQSNIYDNTFEKMI